MAAEEEPIFVDAHVLLPSYSPVHCPFCARRMLRHPDLDGRIHCHRPLLFSDGEGPVVTHSSHVLSSLDPAPRATL